MEGQEERKNSQKSEVRAKILSKIEEIGGNAAIFN